MAPKPSRLIVDLKAGYLAFSKAHIAHVIQPGQGTPRQLTDHERAFLALMAETLESGARTIRWKLMADSQKPHARNSSGTR